MSKYILAIFVSVFIGILPMKVDAAISFGASLGGFAQGTTSSLHLDSLSVSGDNAVILVAIHYNSTSATVSSLNWDDGSGGSAQPFVQLGDYQTVEAGTSRVSLWYLLAPTQTNSRIILNNSDSVDTYMAADYYNGVAQSSTFATPVQNTENSTPASQTSTSDTDGSWHIGAFATQNSGLAPGADTTQRIVQNSTVALYDSGVAIDNSVSHTFNWNWNHSSSGYVATIMRPFVEPSASTSDPGSNSGSNSSDTQEPAPHPTTHYGSVAQPVQLAAASESSVVSSVINEIADIKAQLIAKIVQLLALLLQG